MSKYWCFSQACRRKLAVSLLQAAPVTDPGTAWFVPLYQCQWITGRNFSTSRPCLSYVLSTVRQSSLCKGSPAYLAAIMKTVPYNQQVLCPGDVTVPKQFSLGNSPSHVTRNKLTEVDQLKIRAKVALHRKLQQLPAYQQCMLAAPELDTTDCEVSQYSSTGDAHVLQSDTGCSEGNWAMINHTLTQLEELTAENPFKFSHIQSLCTDLVRGLKDTNDAEFFEVLKRVSLLRILSRVKTLQNQITLSVKAEMEMREKHWTIQQLIKSVEALFSLELSPSVKPGTFEEIFCRRISSALSELSSAELILCLLYSHELCQLNLDQMIIWAQLKKHVDCLCLAEICVVCYVFYNNIVLTSEPKFVHQAVLQIKANLPYCGSGELIDIFKFLFMCSKQMSVPFSIKYNESFRVLISENFIDNMIKQFASLSPAALWHIARFYQKNAWFGADLVSGFVKTLNELDWSLCRLKYVSGLLYILSHMNIRYDDNPKLFHAALKELKHPSDKKERVKKRHYYLDAVNSLAVCGQFDKDLLQTCFMESTFQQTLSRPVRPSRNNQDQQKDGREITGSDNNFRSRPREGTSIPVFDYIQIYGWLYKTVEIYKPDFEGRALPDVILKPTMIKALKTASTARNKLLLEIKTDLCQLLWKPDCVQLDYFLLHFWSPDIGLKVDSDGNLLPFKQGGSSETRGGLLDGTDTATLVQSVRDRMATQTLTDLLDYDPFLAGKAEDEPPFERVVLVVHGSKAFYKTHLSDYRNGRSRPPRRLDGYHKERERQLQQKGCRVIAITAPEYKAARNKIQFLQEKLQPLKINIPH